MHIAVNRVSPLTFAAVYPDRDYYKLDRAMRELELRFGWSHDNGPLVVRERNGTPVIEWRSAGPDTKGHVPAAAADMERHGARKVLSAMSGASHGACFFRCWRSLSCRGRNCMRI